MWLTADGVAHTVALPDWRAAVGEGRDQLERLGPEGGAALGAALSTYEAELFEEIAALSPKPEVEERFTKMAPPPLAVRPAADEESWVVAVVPSIRAADPRWRLDYVSAMQDACDELSPSTSA